MSSMSESAWAHPQAEMLRGLRSRARSRRWRGRAAQVPDDVDVVLEQPEVDPDAVHVVEVAQLARIDQVLDAADGVAEEVGVVDHQHPAVAGRPGRPGLGLRGRWRPAASRPVRAGRLPGTACDGKWVEHGGGDRHGVKGQLEKLVQRPHTLDVSVVASDRLQPLRIRVADRHDLGQRTGGEVADEVRTPVARSDDGNSEFAHDIPDQMMSANATLDATEVQAASHEKDHSDGHRNGQRVEIKLPPSTQARKLLIRP